MNMKGCIGAGFDGTLETDLELRERFGRKEQIRSLSTDLSPAVEYVNERQEMLKCLTSRDGARVGGGCAWCRQLQPRKRSRQTSRSPPA